MKKKPVALIDLDGTCADFDGAMRRDLKSLCAIGEAEYFAAEDEDLFPHVKARRDMIKRQPDWWFNLAPLNDGIAVVHLLVKRGFRLHVLTRGPKKLPEAWAQKVRWALKHLPEGAQVTVTTADKADVSGSVLVDDWIPYAEPWISRRERGLLIMPARPWNRGFAHERCFRLGDGPDDFSRLDLLLSHHLGGDHE